MIFTIKTSDKVAGIDIMEALMKAGIDHTIISKQHDNAVNKKEQSEEDSDTEYSDLSDRTAREMRDE